MNKINDLVVANSDVQLRGLLCGVVVDTLIHITSRAESVKRGLALIDAAIVRASREMRGAEPVCGWSWWTSIADMTVACDGRPNEIDDRQPGDIQPGTFVLTDGSAYTETRELITCPGCLKAWAEAEAGK